MNFSLKQIRYFVAVAESRQISKAAVALSVSQSAVTAAIQQLEACLDVQLFDRTSHGVILTPTGSRFMLQARNVMAACDEAMRLPSLEMQSIAGRVRVGITYTVAGYFLPRQHVRFSRNFPHVAIELFEAPRREIEEALLAGTLDIAVMLVSNLQADDRLQSELLFRSRRQLWTPTDHPLLQRDTIRLADVSGHPFVMLSVDEADKTADRYWSRTQYEPNVIFTTSSVEAVRSMVAAGMGITILSDMVYRPWSLEGQRIETRQLVDDIPTMDVGLAWVRGRVFSEAASAFRDFLTIATRGGS